MQGWRVFSVYVFTSAIFRRLCRSRTCYISTCTYSVLHLLFLLSLGAYLINGLSSVHYSSYNLLIALWLSCSLLLSQTSTQLLLCLLSLLYSLLHNAVTGTHVHATHGALAGAVGLSQQHGFLHSTPGNWWRLWLCPWSPCPAWLCWRAFQQLFWVLFPVRRKNCWWWLSICNVAFSWRSSRGWWACIVGTLPTPLPVLEVLTSARATTTVCSIVVYFVFPAKAYNSFPVEYLLTSYCIFYLYATLPKYCTLVCGSLLNDST